MTPLAVITRGIYRLTIVDAWLLTVTSIVNGAVLATLNRADEDRWTNLERIPEHIRAYSERALYLAQCAPGELAKFAESLNSQHVSTDEVQS